MTVSGNLIVLYILGFIDFIVEPSFQVMGDMLEKILSPLRSQSSHNIDEAISEEVFDKETCTRGTSAGKNLPKQVPPGKYSVVLFCSGIFPVSQIFVC